MAKRKRKTDLEALAAVGHIEGKSRNKKGCETDNAVGKKKSKANDGAAVPSSGNAAVASASATATPSGDASAPTGKADGMTFNWLVTGDLGDAISHVLSRCRVI